MQKTQLNRTLLMGSKDGSWKKGIGEFQVKIEKSNKKEVKVIKKEVKYEIREKWC